MPHFDVRQLVIRVLSFAYSSQPMPRGMGVGAAARYVMVSGLKAMVLFAFMLAPWALSVVAKAYAPRWPRAVGLVVLVLCTVPVYWFGRRVHVCVRRLDAGQCMNCGYDLTGNVSGVCPECGEAVYRRPEPDVSPPPPRSGWDLMVIGASAVLASTGALAFAYLLYRLWQR